MAVSLPKAVEAYFGASNAHDANAMARSFAAEAIVHDEGKTHRGRAEIEGWARDTIAKYRTMLTPLGVRDN
ncbi:MAG: nuclear transport factor 2 family protein, partial [Pseudolabrys sp.]